MTPARCIHRFDGGMPLSTMARHPFWNFFAQCTSQTRGPRTNRLAHDTAAPPPRPSHQTQAATVNRRGSPRRKGWSFDSACPSTGRYGMCMPRFGSNSSRHIPRSSAGLPFPQSSLTFPSTRPSNRHQPTRPFATPAAVDAWLGDGQTARRAIPTTDRDLHLCCRDTAAFSAGDTIS